jgi:predicted nucleic acid-binding protein
MAWLVSIDANVIVALLDTQDKWHAKAIALRDALLTADVHLVYFDCVISEAIGVIGRRTEEQGRPEQFIHMLDGLLTMVPEQHITWISVFAQSLFQEVLSLCRRHGGRLNFNDALIAQSCQKLSIPLIMSFDGDFDAIAWLTRIADPAAIPDLLSRGSCAVSP